MKLGTMRVRGKKKGLTVTVDSVIMERLKSAGINVSAFVNEAVKRHIEKEDECAKNRELQTFKIHDL